MFLAKQRREVAESRARVSRCAQRTRRHATRFEHALADGAASPQGLGLAFAAGLIGGCLFDEPRLGRILERAAGAAIQLGIAEAAATLRSADPGVDEAHPDDAM